MTTQREAREKSLGPLLRSALGSTFTDDLVAMVIDAEDQMTENREHLTILHQRGVLSDNELATKLNMCFEIFIQQVSKILGEDACRIIYDYGPGEKIDLVSTEDSTRVGQRYALLIGTTRSQDSRLPALPVVVDDIGKLLGDVIETQRIIGTAARIVRF